MVDVLLQTSTGFKFTLVTITAINIIKEYLNCKGSESLCSCTFFLLIDAPTRRITLNRHTLLNKISIARPVRLLKGFSQLNKHKAPLYWSSFERTSYYFKYFAPLSQKALWRNKIQMIRPHYAFIFSRNTMKK